MKYELNNIYCVDSYKAIKDIPDKSIDLIVTDPPYQLDSLTGGGMLKEKRIQNLMTELGDKQLDIGISEEILDDFMRVMKKPNIYIWMNLKQLYFYLNYFVGKHNCNWNLIVWQKSNAMPLCGGKYLNDCEYCAYFYKGVKLNTRYETAKTVYIKEINVEDKKQFGHPTIKPLDIIKNLIENSSGGGAIILDTFSGSGTTCVAAKELGRQYLGFEIDEHYWKISVDRLNGINKNGQTSLLDTDFEQLSLLEESKN